MNFKIWLFRKSLRPSTVKHYAGAIYGKLSELACRVGSERPIYELELPEEVDGLISRLEEDPVYVQLNDQGHRMYQAALGQYRSYLRERLTADTLEEVLRNPALPATVRTAVISARVGQGRYRAELIRLWKGRCSVTGYDDPQMLLASHIKPWCVANNTERLDPENGLLLTPNLDRAFDSGLITFDTENKGKLLLSKAFRHPETLGITDGLRLTKLTARTKNYLKFHRKQVFLSEADLGLKG